MDFPPLRVVLKRDCPPTGAEKIITMIKRILFSVFLLTVILALEIQAAEICLPKTGQVNCFDGVWGYQVECKNSGQDGEYRT